MDNPDEVNMNAFVNPEHVKRNLLLPRVTALDDQIDSQASDWYAAERRANRRAKRRIQP